MPITDLTDQELDQFERNYRRQNRSEGGIYTLSEVLLEKKRRRPSPFGVREVAAKIVELAAQSHDGLLTYGDIWHAFRPNVPWEGNYSQKIVADCLNRVIHYCVTNRLPILTVLVVRSNNRRLTLDAIENIVLECKELGIETGLDSSAFIQEQIALSRNVVAENLPAE
jgi:hypothetical protein